MPPSERQSGRRRELGGRPEGDAPATDRAAASIGDIDVQDIDNVRMAGQSARLRAVPEGTAPDTARRGRREDLHRHRPVQRGLRAAVDDAETTPADLVGILEPGRRELRHDRT